MVRTRQPIVPPVDCFDEVMPPGNVGQLNAVLKAGVETISYNRPDVSQILKAGRSTNREN